MGLLDQVRDTLRRRHCSPRTEETYVDWIRRFIRFHGVRHPAAMGEPEIVVLNSLAREGLSASSQDQALNAVLFLCEVVERIGQAEEVPVAGAEGSAVEGAGWGWISARFLRVKRSSAR